MIASVTHTPSWALWTAFGLAAFDLSLWAFVLWFARRTWRQLKPALAPYMAVLIGGNMLDKMMDDEEAEDRTADY